MKSHDEADARIAELTEERNAAQWRAGELAADRDDLAAALDRVLHGSGVSASEQSVYRALLARVRGK